MRHGTYGTHVQTLDAPTICGGLVWLAFFLVVMASVAYFCRPGIKDVIYNIRRIPRIALTVGAIYLLKDFAMIACRLAQSYAMYGTQWREGVWVPVWALASDVAFTAVLFAFLKPRRLYPISADALAGRAREQSEPPQKEGDSIHGDFVA